MTEIDRIRRAHAEAQPDAIANPAWANCHRDCGILLEEIKKLQKNFAMACVLGGSLMQQTMKEPKS